MALQDLIARLEADADARVQAIRARADDAVRALEASEARAAAEIVEQHLAARRATRQAALARELAQARHRARAEALTARRGLLQRVLKRAEALIPEVAATQAYRAALPGHLDEALSYLEGLRPLVKCPPSSAPLLEPRLAGRDDVTLLVEASVGAGLVAEAADGSVVVDNTLRARLRRREAHLAVELVREDDSPLPLGRGPGRGEEPASPSGLPLTPTLSPDGGEGAGRAS